MKWFGESWGAPVCESTPHTDAPVGEACVECGVMIVEGERGVIVPFLNPRNPQGKGELAYHLPCFLRLVIPEGLVGLVPGLIPEELPSITCPRCGMTSHHPKDVAEGYCGNCHAWTSPPREETSRC